MSKYTTGEIANLCGVSVRTVQYYDTRGILVPSELSEGGRRIYSEQDLNRMKTICFLRELDMPINSIKELLAEEQPENAILLLLDARQETLRTEISEKQIKCNRLEELKQSLKKTEHFSVESIGDVAKNMENKKNLQKVHKKMLAVGIVMDIVEVGLLTLWILKGLWLPFAIGMCIVVAMGVWVTRFYYKNVSYICPGCHAVFKPAFRQFLFSKHTPSTRKLTCTSCGHHGFCVETCRDE